MKKISVFLLGPVGGVIGATPTLFKDYTLINFIIAFAFAYGLTLLSLDFLRQYQERIKQEREMSGGN
jgi:hypothetical protein